MGVKKSKMLMSCVFVFAYVKACFQKMGLKCKCNLFYDLNGFRSINIAMATANKH